MATNLFGAIEAKFAATAALTTSCPGGLWTTFAPEGTDRPYCVLVPVSAVPTFTTGLTYIDTSVFQFSIIGDTSAAIYTAMRDLETAFDNTALTLTGTDAHINTMRTNEHGPFALEDNPSTWEGMVEYRVMVQRTL